MNKITALKILDLDDSATFEQAKKSYHAMAKKFHPVRPVNPVGKN